MAVTVVFVARVPVRKKIIKQFKSNASAKKAIQALSSRFTSTFYSPKLQKRKRVKRKKQRYGYSKKA